MLGKNGGIQYAMQMTNTHKPTAMGTGGVTIDSTSRAGLKLKCILWSYLAKRYKLQRIVT